MLGVSVLPARAEIVFFNTGRNLSVDSHRVEGDQIVMAMRGGGEMTLDAALVSRIEPDEVPYPEAPAAPPPADAAPLRRLPTSASKPIRGSIPSSRRSRRNRASTPRSCGR